MVAAARKAQAHDFIVNLRDWKGNVGYGAHVGERGRIVEQGTHAELLRLGGHYEKLWRHQSGGFLAEDVRLETDVEALPRGEARAA